MYFVCVYGYAHFIVLICANEIKPYPLTANTYSNQWMLLTLNVSATTISVTDHAQSFSLVYFYYSVAIVIKDTTVNYTIFYSFSLW